MFGLVEWRGAGERCGAREKRLGGVRFLAVGIRRGDGLRAVWSLRTAARTLERYGVTQAVFPRGFSLYERFAARGIVPVDVRPLREAAAAAIARRVMAQQEIAPRRATVALCAARVTRAYAAAAETLAADTRYLQLWHGAGRLGAVADAAQPLRRRGSRPARAGGRGHRALLRRCGGDLRGAGRCPAARRCVAARDLRRRAGREMAAGSRSSSSPHGMPPSRCARRRSASKG